MTRRPLFMLQAQKSGEAPREPFEMPYIRLIDRFRPEEVMALLSGQAVTRKVGNGWPLKVYQGVPLEQYPTESFRLVDMVWGEAPQDQVPTCGRSADTNDVTI